MYAVHKPWHQLESESPLPSSLKYPRCFSMPARLEEPSSARRISLTNVQEEVILDDSMSKHHLFPPSGTNGYEADVKKMMDTINENPEALLEQDSDLRFPLHVACEYGASPKIIETLIRSNKYAVLAMDSLGRLPIHVVCECYLSSCKMQSKSSRLHPMECLQCVLQMLLKICPGSVLVEDNEGICPIEYAIEAGLPYEIVFMLQKTAEKERKYAPNAN